MPWLETNVANQRIQFVIAMQQTGAKLARVCRAFHISRTTGYKWLARDAAAHSVAALADRSRRPHGSPRRTALATTKRVIALREEYGWGGEKLLPTSEVTTHGAPHATSLAQLSTRLGAVAALASISRTDEGKPVIDVGIP